MKLGQYLYEKRIPLTQFARTLGVPVATAHDWKSGRRVPRLASLVAIEKATKGAVTARDFVETKESVCT